MSDMAEKGHIFGSIFALANRLQVLGDKLDENLTVKQWLLIASISGAENAAPAISEIANRIGYSRQNVKKMALILEREGFLELRKDPDDARILRVSLSKKCIDYFRHREKKEIEFIEQLFAGFDTDLIRALNSGILKLEDNIIEMERQYEPDEKE